MPVEESCRWRSSTWTIPSRSSVTWARSSLVGCTHITSHLTVSGIQWGFYLTVCVCKTHGTKVTVIMCWKASSVNVSCIGWHRVQTCTQLLVQTKPHLCCQCLLSVNTAEYVFYTACHLPRLTVKVNWRLQHEQGGEGNKWSGTISRLSRFIWTLTLPGRRS